MRHMTMVLVSGMLAASLLAACNDDSTPTSPSSGSPTSPAPSPTNPPATGGGTGGGTGAAAPATAAVTVGDIFFRAI